ncbi:MAG TPA: hypothetical protein VE987_04250, partial [Polyangiaceae bacterium]|nr:hypothetical protein [Polyangiaceae bacterium]
MPTTTFHRLRRNMPWLALAGPIPFCLLCACSSSSGDGSPDASAEAGRSDGSADGGTPASDASPGDAAPDAPAGLVAAGVRWIGRVDVRDAA